MAIVFEGSAADDRCGHSTVFDVRCLTLLVALDSNPLVAMAGFPPITVQAVDENGNTMLDASVPFSYEMDVRAVMERAFVLKQAADNHDPFIYVLHYYGYSKDLKFPGFLGYELEEIGDKANNGKFYWKLLIDGQASLLGADTTLPHPGSTVRWEYTPISASAEELTGRVKAVHLRRSARLATARRS